MTRVIKLLLFFSVLLVFVLGTNCDEKNVFSLTNMEWILVLINEHPNIFHDNLFDTQPDSTSGGPDSPSFYRQITSRHTYEDSIIINDTLVPDVLIANVWETDSIAGKFRIYDNGVWHETTFVACSKMRAYLEKWGQTGDAYNGWLIKGVSPIITYTYGVASFVPPFNLNVTSSGGENYNYVSTDINSMVDFNNFPLVFSVGDTVYLHLSSVDKTNHIHLHYYDGNTLKKVRFVDNGTLDAQFVVTDASLRYRHFFIDIVDKNSVGPPPGNYRARTWGILYKSQ
ncbi:MAG: hypothetical protein MUO85_07755 [candidate division Zixibacteria bacterium]|nr:hypothetical protein [candidate division Zixibacteria bacterium]